jgi:type IV secretion system protein TrbE
VKLESRFQAFTRQLSDFLQTETLGRQAQFTFFRRLLNFDDWRIAGRPRVSQFLDYQVVNSDIAAERDHLRIGDHYVRLLTMKKRLGEPGHSCSTNSSRSMRTSMW